MKTACYAGENRKAAALHKIKKLQYDVIGLATEFHWHPDIITKMIKR